MSDIDDKFKPVQSADVTDLALLPKRFDLFASEVRDAFGRLTTQLGDRIIPMLERIESRLSDMEVRVDRLERGHDDLKKRVAALETRRTKKRK